MSSIRRSNSCEGHLKTLIALTFLIAFSRLVFVPSDRDALEALLPDLKASYAGFESRLQLVNESWSENDLFVSGHFLYPKYKDGEPNLTDLVEYMYWRTIRFCLPRKEIEEKRRKVQEENDERYFHELADKAKGLFQKARGLQKKAGEPGELLLFMMLEHLLGAPQIACKMYLKTSENMPVHGSDGVHLGVTQDGKELVVYWGESKVYQDVDSALDQICTSVKKFITTLDEDNRSPKDRDLDIIRDHLDVTDENLRSKLLEYFDPYSEKANLTAEVYACFVAFDAPDMANWKGLTVDEVKQKAEEVYKTKIKAACQEFARLIRANDLSNVRFHFFLVPVPSVAKLRELFFKKLGVAA